MRSLDAAGTSVVLDVVRVDGEKRLKRLELYPDHGGGDPRSESVRERLVAPNGNLNEGKFTPMDPLFDHTAEGGPKRSPDWETEFRGLRIHYTYTGSVLEISSQADARRTVRMDSPLKTLEPMGEGDMLECVNQGKPMRRWTA